MMASIFTRTNKDIKSIFVKTCKNSRKQKQRKRRGIIAVIGLLLVLVQFAVSLLFLSNLIALNILPVRYLSMLILFILLIGAYDFTSQFTKAHVWGKFLSIVMSVVLLYGCIASGKIKNTLYHITNDSSMYQTQTNSFMSAEKEQPKEKGKSFAVYVSGNDEYGNITENGKSDVNILAVINPKTRQILLISTPRDYYITISGFDEKGNLITGLDKFTHAGNAGIQYSIEALENLYGVDVDYFFKINFDGFINIIDAMGGITINSNVEFTNGTDAAPEQYHFVVGPNECDGAKALAFVRERNCFSNLNGDVQRGRNQEAVITAMLDKVLSPSVLVQYVDILDAVSTMMFTNMPMEFITSLVKDQLDDLSDWNVQSYALNFIEDESGSKLCQVYGGYRWVAVPDYNMVNKAIEMIDKIENDEIFDVSVFAAE